MQKGVGKAKITVTSKENKNIKAECNITVIVSATSLIITPKEKQIRVEETVQISGTIEPGDVTSNALTWSTSNAEIATVNSNGLVTAVSSGEVIITAKTVNGIEDTSKITVKEPIFQAATVANKTLAGSIPQGKFTLGDGYIINVDETHKYHFYVLSVEGDKVNLIMSNNICSDGTLATSFNNCTVAWVSKEDYNDHTNYGGYGKNDKGPITAMNYLYEATQNWSNISNIQMNFGDEGQNYGTIKTSGTTTIITKKDGTTTATYENLKARLPKESEMNGTKCSGNNGSCPAWMVNGLTSSSYYLTGRKEDIEGITGYCSLSSLYSYSNRTKQVNSSGQINHPYVNNNIYGIRPVIEVLKSDLS